MSRRRNVQRLARQQLHSRHDEVQLDAADMQVAHPKHPVTIMPQPWAGERLEVLHELALLRFGRGILGSKAQHARLVLPAMWHRVHEVDHALRMALQNFGHDRAACAFDLARGIPFGLAVLIIVHDEFVDEVLHCRSGLALAVNEELDHHLQLQWLCANFPSFRSMPTSRLRIAKWSRKPLWTSALRKTRVTSSMSASIRATARSSSGGAIGTLLRCPEVTMPRASLSNSASGRRARRAMSSKVSFSSCDTRKVIDLDSSSMYLETETARGFEGGVAPSPVPAS